MKGTNVYPSPGFSADAAIRSAEARKATTLLGTPTMFIDIIQSKIRKDHDLSSLKYAVLGGAPISPSLAISARDELNTLICCAYGATETTGGSFLTPFGTPDDILYSTVGYVQLYGIVCHFVRTSGYLCRSMILSQSKNPILTPLFLKKG